MRAWWIGMKQRFGVAAISKYDNKGKKNVCKSDRMVWAWREKRKKHGRELCFLHIAAVSFFFFGRPIVNLRDKLDLFCAIRRTASFKWLLFHRILYYTFVCLALAKATQSHCHSLCNGSWDCCGCLCMWIAPETNLKIAKHILSLRFATAVDRALY